MKADKEQVTRLLKTAKGQIEGIFKNGRGGPVLH